MDNEIVIYIPGENDVAADVPQITLDLTPMRAAIDNLLLHAKHKKAARDEIERLRSNLLAVAAGEKLTRMGRAAKAEMIFEIHEAETWKLLTNQDTGNPYTWTEFSRELSRLFGISSATIGNYVRDVRSARSALMLEPGDLGKYGGLKPLRAFLPGVTGIDARASEDIAKTARPATRQAQEIIARRHGEGRSPDEIDDWRPLLRAEYLENYAHDDSFEVKKLPGELHQQTNDLIGKSSVSWDIERVDGELLLKWYAKYPDEVKNGVVTKVIEPESGSITIGFLPEPVMASLRRGLRIND